MKRKVTANSVYSFAFKIKADNALDRDHIPTAFKFLRKFVNRNSSPKNISRYELKGLRYSTVSGYLLRANCQYANIMSAKKYRELLKRSCRLLKENHYKKSPLTSLRTKLVLCLGAIEKKDFHLVHLMIREIINFYKTIPEDDQKIAKKYITKSFANTIEEARFYRSSGQDRDMILSSIQPLYNFFFSTAIEI